MSTDPEETEELPADGSESAGGEDQGASEVPVESLTLGRTILLVAGVAAIALGLAVWAVPGETLADVLVLFGEEQRIVRLWLGGVLLGALFLSRLLLQSVPSSPALSPRAVAQEPESDAERAIQPGMDVDGRLAEMVDDQSAYEAHREDLTEDIRAIAIATLCYYEGYSHEEALEHLAAGDWTDDPMAASLFADETLISYRTRFFRWLSPSRTYRQQVEAAVDQLRAREQ